MLLFTNSDIFHTFYKNIPTDPGRVFISEPIWEEEK